jgi:hypothetical protein
MFLPAAPEGRAVEEADGAREELARTELAAREPLALGARVDEPAREDWFVSQPDSSIARDEHTTDCAAANEARAKTTTDLIETILKRIVVVVQEKSNKLLGPG